MWMASILQVLALGAIDPTAPLAASAAPAPIYWRQALFSIPFHVERPDRPAQEAVEVQLYVSPDRGVHWDNWRQAKPEKGFFLFKAGADGEYWFDVRTLDRSGQVRPQGPHLPKLIVIVDTLPPKVKLTAVRGDAGQITAAFRMEELYPKLDSLTVEYRLTPTAPWQAVSVGPKDIRSHDAQQTGEVTWYPQNTTAAMEVRLRVTDLAGNPAESHANVVAVPAAANPVRPPPGSIAAIADGTNPLGPRTPISPAPVATTALPAAPAKAADSWQPLGPQTGKSSWPTENTNPAVAATATPATSQNDPGSSSVAMRVSPPFTNQFVSEQSPASAPTPPSSLFSGFTASRPIGPATAATTAVADNANPPPGTRLRWINSRVFQFDYDTRSVGAKGDVPVELWGTRDGGKTWQSFGRDPKGQSPMLVNTSEEGIYGFRMAIQSDASTAGRPPLPGEAPGFWIGIDLTRPVGRITSAQQGVGRDGDKLFISWEASDDRELAAKPISLSYSERLGGPWTAIANGLENTGRYAWQLTGGLPQRIYLRLEVHDAAGNMGVYETSEPVSLDLSSPAAQLRDLRPLSWLNSQPGEQMYLR